MTNRLIQSLDPPTRQRVAALEQAAAAGEEPGAAAVAAAFPPLRHHSTIVGVAHHRDRIHVCWDGTLVSVGVAQVRMTLGAERTPWRELAAEPTHELLGGFLPVVVTTLRYADLVVRQTVVGYSEELSPDRALLALARLEVRNAHAAAATAHVGFRFERGLTLPEARADADARFGDHALVRDGRFVEWENGGLIAACDAAFAAAAEWRGHTLAGALAVPAGGSASVELRLARRPLAPAQRATLTDPEFDAVVAATARSWRGWLQRGAQLELPDRETCAAFRAWAIYGALLSGQEQVYWGLHRRQNGDSETLTMNPQTRAALQMGLDNTIEDAFIFATPPIQRDLGTTLQDIEYEALATLIATEGDLEAEYQRFVDRWLREGGASWQEQATVIYQRERGL